MEHISCDLHNELFNASHASLLFEKHNSIENNYIQPFLDKLHKNSNLKNTSCAFVEAKSSMVSSK